MEPGGIADAASDTVSDGGFTTVVTLHYAADYVLGGVYLTLAAALVYLVSRARAAVPAPALYVAAAAFSIACGLTHLIAPATRWSPTSWAGAGVKVACAIASLTTIALFIRMLPDIVSKLLEAQRARTVLEAELAGRAGELGELAEELAESRHRADVACAEAERASRMKSDFLSLVAHELRTPVTILKLNTQEAVAVPIDGNGGERAERITSASERLLRISETLLAYAALHAGVATVQLRDVDVATVARRVVDGFELQARANGRRLTLSIPSERERALADAQLLRVVLEHLVDNAIRYGGRSDVSVEILDGKYELSVLVRDRGPGLPTEVRERLFEPFVTGESVVYNHAPGLGIGLALVRQAVIGMGGRIELQETAGGGTTFVVFLPRNIAH